MKCVIQRVSEASVEVNGSIVSAIKEGLLVLAGIERGDQEPEIRKAADKILMMRIFADDQGKTNKSVRDIKGSILAVSQFTLAAAFKGGTRPSFDTAEKPQRAEALFNYMVTHLRSQEIEVKTGVFGAGMRVALVNDGPFTIVL